LQTAYKVFLALASGLALFYAFQGFYLDFMYFFSNAFPPFIAGAAVVSSGFALRKYGCNLRSRFSLVWLSFALGLALWFLGELCWAVYTLIIGVEMPYPSIADVFWLSGYIPLFAALFVYVKIFMSALSKRMIGIALAVVSALSIIVSIILIIPVVGAEEDLVKMFFDFAYPFSDVALLTMAILGLAVFSKGNLGRPWLLINAGIMSVTGADILFSCTTAQETFYCGHPLELLFHYGYMLFLLAFYVHTKEL
jgi:hypothetical protein